MPDNVGYQRALDLTISLCLTYTIGIAAIRVWIRRGAFGLDDLVIAISTIIALCNVAAGYVALNKGLGAPWAAIEKAGTVAPLNKASIAGIVTFLVALYMSKCAMLFFLGRITKAPRQVQLFMLCNVVVAVLGGVSILVAMAGCLTESGYYWAFGGNSRSCPSQSARWQVITGLDILTEVLLLALPLYLVWGLQMPWRKKAIVLMAFHMRLPVLGFSIGRNHYTMRLESPQSDAGLGSALVVIWLQVELAYGLAASTLSAIKTFTESFQTCFGLGFTRGKGDGSYGMSNLSGSSGPTSKAEQPKDPSTICSTAITGHGSSVVHETPTTSAERALTSWLTTSTDHPLRLRPEASMQSFTHISANPSFDFGGSGESITHGRDVLAPIDDLVIFRETAFGVQHDETPILSGSRTL